MQKYLAIIDKKTGYVFLICITITYVCLQFNFSFDLNITLFSIAVIFPLVFTIREAFRKRTSVIKLLSMFKSSLNSIYYCFAHNNKLSDENKRSVAEKLHAISHLFFDALTGSDDSVQKVNNKLSEIMEFVNLNRDTISNGVALKIIRFVKDVDESIENTIGLKTHGTPISLRAYCLVFIYLFPFVFIPTLVYDLGGGSNWIIYALGIIHGFILISLYNVQDHIENPFDQIGLDDIKLEEFHFEKSTPLAEETQSATP